MNEVVTTRVFLVEDQPSMRERLREFLEGIQGVEVVGDAATPGNAVDGILASHPDLVLLDFQLDGGTGIDVLRGVRRRVPNVVFVVLTQHDAAQYRRACLDVGANYVFDKTAELGHIRQVIADVAAVRN